MAQVSADAQFGALAKMAGKAAGGGGKGGGVGGDPGSKAKQNAPNINVVDNGRVMIPEGADPTAVKLIIGDIMNNGIGGIKGAMGILRELGGPQGFYGLKIPENYMA